MTTNDKNISEQSKVDNNIIQAIEQLKKGKKEGFSYIYSSTYKYVYSRAKCMFSDEQEVQDLMQEVYLAVYKNIDSLEAPEKIYGWLKTIIFYQSTKLMKKRQKEILVSEDNEEIFESLPDEEKQTESELMDKQDIQIIKACIERLSEEQRTVILAYYYDNMKVDEIAELFQSSEGTVKSRLYLARKKLKEYIEAQEKKQGYKLHSFGGITIAMAIRAYLQQNMEESEVLNKVLFEKITSQLHKPLKRIIAEKILGIGVKKIALTSAGVLCATAVAVISVVIVSSGKPQEPVTTEGAENSENIPETITSETTEDTEALDTQLPSSEIVVEDETERESEWESEIVLDSETTPETETIIPEDSEQLGEVEAEGKLVDWIIYEYNSLNQNVVTKYYDGIDDTSFSQTKSLYDIRGNKIEAKHYEEDGTLSWWNEYEYDANDNMVKEMNFFEEDDYEWGEYVYDTNGNIKRIDWYDYLSDELDYAGYDIYEYDENGRKFKYQSYSAEGRVDDWYECEYDERGRMIKFQWYTSSGNIDDWTEYEYDEKDRLVKKKNYRGSGNVWAWYEYEYDEKDRLVKTKTYYKGMGLSWLEKYEYDEIGRLVKEEKYDMKVSSQ